MNFCEYAGPVPRGGGGVEVVGAEGETIGDERAEGDLLHDDGCEFPRTVGGEEESRGMFVT